ncbi:MAG: hypothetical protein M3R26_02020 [Actinomycetota bacterium]|nr:hypothetical protein [Actinomycetota bacterium]
MARKHLSGLVAVLIASALLAFALLHSPRQAQAAPSGYSFAGGTAREHATVLAALAASSFDWSLVPGHVTIHISPEGSDSHASQGEIWLDPRLLAHGRAAWGVVQHEYAHQVDFFLLDDATRAKLDRQLGAKIWWTDEGNLRHDQYGAERFASTLAWAYWPSSHNTLIRYARAEATAMPPAKFRRLMDELLASRS